MNQLVEELRAAIWSVWNRRWLALGVAWAICLAGWLVVALIPNSYESQARIFVQLDDVLAEMRSTRMSERAGRLIDQDQGASMERKKREGYF